MKRIIWLLAAVGYLASWTPAVRAEHHQGPETVVFNTTIGTISFQHFKHQAKISDCIECHHKGVEKGKCTGCHGVDKSAPKAVKAFHHQCKGCHRDAGGPTYCHDCHIKP